MSMAPATTLPSTGVVRSPLAVWMLALVTLGVYGVVRHYVVNRELRDFGVEVNPALSTLAVVPGSLLLAPPLVSVWRTASRIAVAQETAGGQPTSRPEVALASTFALLTVVAYTQRELNRVWELEHVNERLGQ